MAVVVMVDVMVQLADPAGWGRRGSLGGDEAGSLQ